MARKAVDKVPLNMKLLLTPNEAAQYAGIGMNKMSELLNQPGCPFVVQNGRHRLVKREELEKYIAGLDAI